MFSRRPGARLNRGRVSAVGRWTPPGYGSSLRQDLIAGAAYYDLGGGGDILTWHDQSGRNNDCTQATTGNQPAIEASGINSRPTVRFVGANTDNMICDAIATLASGTDVAWTIASVVQTISSVGCLCGFGRSSSAIPAHNIQSPANAGTGKFRSFRRDDAAASVTVDSTEDADTDPHVQVWTFSGTTLTQETDGAATSIAAVACDVGAATFNRFTIGAQRLNAGAINPLDCRIGRFMFWNAALSAGDRANVAANLKRLYGIA